MRGKKRTFCIVTIFYKSLWKDLLKAQMETKLRYLSSCAHCFTVHSKALFNNSVDCWGENLPLFMWKSNQRLCPESGLESENSNKTQKLFSGHGAATVGCSNKISPHWNAWSNAAAASDALIACFSLASLHKIYQPKHCKKVSLAMV